MRTHRWPYGPCFFHNKFLELTLICRCSLDYHIWTSRRRWGSISSALLDPSSMFPSCYALRRCNSPFDWSFPIASVCSRTSSVRDKKGDDISVQISTKQKQNRWIRLAFLSISPYFSPITTSWGSLNRMEVLPDPTEPFLHGRGILNLERYK